MLLISTAAQGYHYLCDGKETCHGIPECHMFCSVPVSEDLYPLLCGGGRLRAGAAEALPLCRAPNALCRRGGRPERGGGHRGPDLQRPPAGLSCPSAGCIRGPQQLHRLHGGGRFRCRRRDSALPGPRIL